MKFATKLMVVPFQQKLSDAVDSRPVELDTKISTILNNPKLSLSEKLEQYKRAVGEFKIADNKAEIKSHPKQEATAMDNTLIQADLLKESLDVLKKDFYKTIEDGVENLVHRIGGQDKHSKIQIKNTKLKKEVGKNLKKGFF